VTSGYEEQSRHYESRVSNYSFKEGSGEYSQVLSLTVLFTTVPGTLAALRKAARLAHQLGARIQILVACVVPYPLPIDKPGVDPEFRLRKFRTFCEQESIETRIDVRLCRDARQCIHASVRPHSLILMGGRQSWWPLTSEKCLARSLKSVGYHVVFVDHDRER
jgi:hypothetical protein